MGGCVTGVSLLSVPELGWAHPCDVWSIGCILFEYYRGFTLYQVACLLPPPPWWKPAVIVSFAFCRRLTTTRSTWL